jgi:Zn finger protein HypA/HybF involved in hydrogenase expression
MSDPVLQETKCPLCHSTADVFDDHFECRKCGSIGDPTTGQLVVWPPDKPLATNVKRCDYCQGAVHRFKHVFQCQNCRAMGDLVTGIMSPPSTMVL